MKDELKLKDEIIRDLERKAFCLEEMFLALT